MSFCVFLGAGVTGRGRGMKGYNPIINWDSLRYKEKLHPRLVAAMDRFQARDTGGKVNWGLLDTMVNEKRGGVFYIPEAGLLGGYNGAWRSVPEQNLLYQAGSTKAKGSEGLHVWGLAVDLVCSLYGYSLDWEWEGRKYNFSGVEGWRLTGLPQFFKSQGLSWGGDWVSFPDLAHFELAVEHPVNDRWVGLDWWDMPEAMPGWDVVKAAEEMYGPLDPLASPVPKAAAFVSDVAGSVGNGLLGLGLVLVVGFLAWRGLKGAR
jgi:hypothetical protein